MFADENLFVSDETDTQPKSHNNKPSYQRPNHLYQKAKTKEDIKCGNTNKASFLSLQKSVSIQPEKSHALSELTNIGQIEQHHTEKFSGYHDKQVKISSRNLDSFLYGQSNEYLPLTSYNSIDNTKSTSFPSQNNTLQASTNSLDQGFVPQRMIQKGLSDNIYSQASKNRIKLAEHKARLTRVQDTNEGFLVVNRTLGRPNDGKESYQNAHIEYGGDRNQNFYDPTFQAKEKENLPKLRKSHVVISYRPEEVEAYGTLQESQTDYSNKEERIVIGENETPAQRKGSGGIDKNKETKVAPEALPEQESSEEDKQNKEKANVEMGVANLLREPYQSSTETLKLDLSNITNMRAFLMAPCPKGYRMECTVKRDRSLLNRFYPKYHCYLSDGSQYLMSSKKRAGSRTSNYLISYNKTEIKKNSPYCLGKLRSNFVGTEFNIYDHGANPNKPHQNKNVRVNLGVVLYEPNLKLSKRLRRMKVYVPDIREKELDQDHFRFPDLKENILNDWKSGKTEDIREFFNKEPQWEEDIKKLEIKSYALDFGGRVSVSSVKNFQLIDAGNKGEHVFLQFGKVSKETYNMDFEWPLSPFQAFAICLSNFDYKIAIE